jgi:L-cysteate sulfo-lyase
MTDQAPTADDGDGTAQADLGVWRTPLEPAPRLGEAIGLAAGDLWIKRDDWLGLGGGGNKLRKLQYLCGRAVAAGADTLVATGAAQSNYARLTAASARRLGLDVVLVLSGDGPGDSTGNLTLQALFGSRIHWAGVADDTRLDAVAAQVAEELRRAGARPAMLPFGGSDGVGAQGYVACGDELLTQSPTLRHVVTAVGSGGTMAGLVLALGAERVIGVDTGAVGDAAARVRDLIRQAADVARRPTPAVAALRLREDQVGPGYERLTDAAWHALRLAGRTAGLVLDPVYTAKAMAGLAAAVADGEIRRGERTIFLHTGGLPGLFGHPAAAELVRGL